MGGVLAWWLLINIVGNTAKGKGLTIRLTYRENRVGVITLIV